MEGRYPFKGELMKEFCPLDADYVEELLLKEVRSRYERQYKSRGNWRIFH